MENQQYTVTETLLLRYFDGTITSQEKIEVEVWIAESEENKKIAKDVYFLHMASEAATILNSTDSEAALKQVNHRLNKITGKIMLQRFQQAAAILFIPLLGTICYFLMNNEPVEYIEIKTTSGMIASLELPDGSKVSLNSGSTLKYPNRFSGNTRSVFLEGEGYFDVNKAKKTFIVNTEGNVQIEVKGTEFNLQSYADEEEVTLTLLSGKVDMKYRDRQNRNKTEEVTPGQKLIYNKNEKNIQDRSGSVRTDIAWKDGKIILQDTSLEETLKYLSRRFNTHFIISNEKLKEHHYTGTFENQHLFRILEYLKFSSGIQYAIVQPSDPNQIIHGKQTIELY